MSGAVVLSLAPLDARRLDGHLAPLSALRLARMDRETLVEIPPEARDRASAAFAYAGIGVAPSARTIAPPPGLVAAVAVTLDPLAAAVPYEVVTVRAVGLADVTRALRRRRGPLGRRRARDLARCRAVLHEEDAVLAWRRVVWADRAVIRRLRGVRPVVFDREAVDRSPERWTFTSEDRLTRWMRG